MLAHPAGEHRLERGLDEWNHRLGYLGWPGHGLWRQHHEHPIDPIVVQASLDRLLIAFGPRIPNDINRIAM